MSGRIPRRHLFVHYLNSAEIGALDNANNASSGLPGMRMVNGRTVWCITASLTVHDRASALIGICFQFFHTRFLRAVIA